MRRARHTSVAVVVALAMSLATAGAASAADFTLPASVNPNQPIAVTPTLTAAETLDAQVVRFQFSDDVELVDSAPPFGTQTWQAGYASAGERTVTMQVEYIVADDAFVSHTIRVNAAPVARFTRNVLIPNPGQTVRFDAGASTDDAALDNDSYDWDFDDNGSFEVDNQRVVQRSFATPGNKVVRMRVTDSGGRTNTFATTIHVNFAPTAALTFNPSTPLVSQRIDFTSISDDPDSAIVSETWDLDGDGQYDDANGSGVSRAFGTPGLHTVRLRVMDSLGRLDTHAVTFNVLSPAVDPPTTIRPWPKIRIVGFAGAKRIRLDLLTVKVLRGATVKVRCAGKGCPRRNKAVSTRSGKKALVRLRWLERRLRPGTNLYFAITYPGKIGRYERITLRRRKEPLRKMQCLYPGEPKARPCP
ncbi:MAG: PKD domain-containing protein [Thermoleophilaceae bacterium]|nr:PKD domain-containing protein [Thermoleophilaceae bacterium]